MRRDVIVGERFNDDDDTVKVDESIWSFGLYLSVEASSEIYEERSI